MKKSIFAIVLMLSVCAGFALSQTKKRVVRRGAKTTTVKKITTPSRTTIIRKTTTPRKTMTTSNSSAVTTESGLTYIVTKNGTGAQLKAGDEIIVNYTGLLTNGTKFDSSLDRGEPFSFPLGAGRVIKGWDEGFQNLKIGDHATLIIPPSIGYGSRGAGGAIPPGATLIFIVEVIGVK
jgi:peptidylprolyl isomerase